MLPSTLLHELGVNPIEENEFTLADGRKQLLPIGEIPSELASLSITVIEILILGSAPVLSSLVRRSGFLGAAGCGRLDLADTTHHKLIPAPELTLLVPIRAKWHIIPGRKEAVRWYQTGYRDQADIRSNVGHLPTDCRRLEGLGDAQIERLAQAVGSIPVLGSGCSCGSYAIGPYPLSDLACPSTSTRAGWAARQSLNTLAR